MTHTPAPWVVTPGHSVVSIMAGEDRIAMVGDGPYWKPYSPQDLADARLIASAPALLEALKDICGMIDNCADVPRVPDSLPMMVLSVARAAIAKAEAK